MTRFDWGGLPRSCLSSPFQTTMRVPPVPRTWGPGKVRTPPDPILPNPATNPAHLHIPGHPGSGAVQHLTRLMGRGRALEVLLSGEDYDAQMAERYGWIATRAAGSTGSRVRARM
jgi:hypothetical protein